MKEEFMKFLYQAGAAISANSPKLAVAGGITGLVIAGVLACKATLKLNETLDECQEMVEDIHKKEEAAVESAKKAAECPEGKDENGEPVVIFEYPKEQKHKELFKVYGKTIWGLTKLYGIPLLLAILSILLILFGFGKLAKINAALVSTCVMYDQKIKQYRENVKESIGEEKEHALFYGLKSEKVEVVDITEEGKEKKTKVTVVSPEADKCASPYSAFFDEYCCNWKKSDPYGNANFLMSAQEMLNIRFHNKGYMFLNEARQVIGLPPVPEGQIVGWIDDKNDPNRDCCIDLGINADTPEARDFRNGLEKSFLIDFNVDGPILDKFGKFIR